MPSHQSTRYCFSTAFTSSHVGSLKASQAECCKYLIYNRQRDASTLEGFFTLKSKLPVTGARKILKLVTPLHLEASKGLSTNLAAAYKQDGDFVEFGKPFMHENKRSNHNIGEYDELQRSFLLYYGYEQNMI